MLINQWSCKSGVGRELGSSDKVAHDRGSVIWLSYGHGHWIALVLVFGLLDSHLRSDVGVLCRLVVDFGEERSSQAEAHGAGSGDDGQENEYL